MLLLSKWSVVTLRFWQLQYLNSSIYAHDNPYFSAGGGGEIDPMDMPTTESSHSGTGTADGILSAPGVLLFAINFLII